jgi:hypothetical protein
VVISRRGDTETSARGPRLASRRLSAPVTDEARCGGTLEKPALGGESRAVARALPRLVRLAPGDEAAKVWAAGREDVRIAGLIAVDGLMAKADTDYGALARRELLPSGTRADSIGDEALGHASILRGE